MHLNPREIRKKERWGFFVFFVLLYFTNHRHIKIGNKEKFGLSK